MTDQEINEAVARKLGWEHIPESKTHPWRFEKVRYDKVPDYCRSIEAAWEIVEKWKPHSFYLAHSERGYGDKEEWFVQFSRNDAVCDCDAGCDTETTSAKATADTAAMAICQAFLKLPS